MQPLRGDPDNLLPEGTNATDKASTPRLGPPDRPGRRTTSTVFSPKGDPSPAAASLQLLRAGDIETNPGPHCYACGNPVRHGTSPLRCSTTNCSTVPHKRPPPFKPAKTVAVPPSRTPRATESTVPANNNSLRQLPTSNPPRHQAPRLRCPGLPGTSPRCEALQRSYHPSR